MKIVWILFIYFLFTVGCAPTYIQPLFKDSNQYFLEKAIDQLDIKKELIRADALEWSMTRGSRSGRVAWQFIQDLAGRHGKKID